MTGVVLAERGSASGTHGAGLANGVRARVQGARQSSPMMVGAYSLMLNTAVSAAIGVGFWVVAARLITAGAVGRDSALLSAMITLSSIGQLNLHNVLVRFLPGRSERLRLMVLGCYVAGCLFTLLLAVGFVVVAPEVSGRFGFLRRDGLLGSLFVAATVLWTVFALQDSVLTALRGAPWVLAENTAFAALKLAALPVLAAARAVNGVFTAWIIPMMLLLIPVNWLIFARAIPAYAKSVAARDAGPSRFSRRQLRSFLALDYIASGIEQVTVQGLPVLVVGLIGNRETAYFYMPFLIITSFDLIFYNVATPLVVEGALAEERVSELARELTRRFGLLLLAGVAVIIVAAPLLLLPFGSEYARHGVPALRILACGSVFRAVIVLFTSIARVDRRAGAILAANVAFGVLLLAFIFVFGSGRGLPAVAEAWVAASAIVAIALLPALIGRLTPTRRRAR
ncbi:MAG: lipopolysaccharide biosynthesis protein [Solirubrobacteraceae bacterium]